MHAQPTMTKAEQLMSELMDFAEMADEQLAKLGKPKGFDEAQKCVFAHWLDNPTVLEVFTRDYIGLTYGLLMAEIYHSVLTAASASRALRQKQVEAIFHLARYGVLLSEPTESQDPTLTPPGLGITGTLGPHAKRLSELFHGMPRWQLLEETPATLDETLDEIEAESIYWGVKASILGELAPLFDGDLDQRFWPAACLTASTAMWEQIYHEVLGLPPALDPQELDKLYRVHSALLNICASGVKDPFLVWNQFQNVETQGLQH
jgi:hypothetical protein